MNLQTFKRFLATPLYGPQSLVAEVRQFCQLDDTGRLLMKSAMSGQARLAQQLSARAYHWVLKLAGREAIVPGHLAEALQYCPRLKSA